MARGVGRDVPRYIFHVTGHSELIERLVELDRERVVCGRGVESRGGAWPVGRRS